MQRLTQESVGNVLGHLVARAAHLGEVCQFPVQHPLELGGEKHIHKDGIFLNALPNEYSFITSKSTNKLLRAKFWRHLEWSQ